MSKRPAPGGGSARPRMSGLVGYLRDRPIWVKLGLIMMVPTIATIFVGFSALIGNIHAANDASRARGLAGLTAAAGTLVNDLQNERAAATMLLTSDSGEPQQQALDDYQSVATTTGKAAGDYTTARDTLAGVPQAFSDQLNTIDAQLSAMPALRQQVAAVNQISLSDTIQRYQGLIKSLIDLRDAASQLAGDSAVSFDLRAGSAIANDKEQLSQERVIVLQVLAAGQLTPKAQQEFLTSLAGQTLSLAPFANVATPAQQSLLSQIVTGPDVREASLYEGRVQSLTPGPLPTDMFSAADWDSAMLGKSDLVRQVEEGIDQQTAVDADALHSRAQRQVLLEAALLLGLVLVAVLIAWLVARSMNRALRELRQGAIHVAEAGLPQAVARLRDPALAGQQLTPQEMAERIAEPLPVRSRDEFGQVTDAFNAVHLEAVRTAAEQAALRASVSTMFVNLARRSQLLVDRLINHLDRLERGEEDPDRLAELFQLDHLATRMRRNDENLLVLAGADSTRVQRDSAGLIDVLRAAQSEVEHYTRIEFGVIDRDIEVAAHAVNDLVHLVAELFDNATAFSPPDSSVVVEARRVGDRAVLYVEDHGIGISPEQLADLNERLATPPVVDVAVSRMMGLVVVARLAARNGVRVELRPSGDRGTIADVLLPTTVLVPRTRQGDGTAMPAAGEVVSRPSARPAFGAPLALESGPAGLPTGPSTGGFGASPAAFAPTGGHGPANGPTGGHGPVNGSAGRDGGHLPAWSDLTGLAGSTPGGPPTIFPTGSPGGAPSGGPVPGAGSRAGRGGPGSTPPGGQPSRSAPGGPVNGTGGFVPRTPPNGSASPLPQRRASDPDAVDGELTGAPAGDHPPIPRQMPSSPEYRPEDGELAEIVDAEVIPDPPATPPPAWPPVASGAPGDRGAESETRPAGEPDPAGPGSPVPAPTLDATKTDTTSEMRRGSPTPVVPAAYTPPPLADPGAVQQPGAVPGPGSPGGHPAPGQPRPGGTPGAMPPPATPPSGTPHPGTPHPAQPAYPSGQREAVKVMAYPDETMELPIFRELESAWFRRTEMPASQPRPAPQTHQPVPSGPSTGAPADAITGNAATGSTTMGSSPMSAGRGPAPEQAWRSAADGGWQAASAAAQPETAGVTDAGLPKRVPMAQLVPGGVDKSAASANRRSPEQVRGLLSAYHRGVQRGRTRADDKNPEPSTATGQSTHGGKEQEA